jgi:hypothetical protein
LNSDQKEFKKRLAKAFELLANIEKDMREGEWGDAVKGCRDAIEPFTKDLTQFIKDMIITTTGLGQKDVEKLTWAFDILFGYATMF